MADVVAIGTRRQDEKLRDLCIDLLERMLAEAKEGRGFETVFLLATFPDSTSYRTAWTVGLSTYEVVARLEHLKHELLADLRESTYSVVTPPEG
jgi:hypothetical protein